MITYNDGPLTPIKKCCLLVLIAVTIAVSIFARNKQVREDESIATASLQLSILTETPQKNNDSLLDDLYKKIEKSKP